MYRKFALIFSKQTDLALEGSKYLTYSPFHQHLQHQVPAQCLEQPGDLLFKQNEHCPITIPGDKE